MKKIITAALLMAASVPVWSFCGFYVAKADTDLFNKASKVVVTRDDDKTVVTMASDYQGEAKDFAIVVPVPSILQEGQVHITENALIDHLDAYTAPRLVEYYDEDPCAERILYEAMMEASSSAMSRDAKQAKSLGVTIESAFTAGEYDILILSAKQSNGLQIWLDSNGYKVPKKARAILGSYIKQGMKFFVAKVNLEEQSKLGLSYLRPIQMAFESEKFMLPIRLGTVNAQGTQEMFVFTLTRKGRVEARNYRTVKIPSDINIPLFVEDEFADFYKAMFDMQYAKENGKAVFLEYAWDMAWCDPCAADPLSNEQLRELGVFWLSDSSGPQFKARQIIPPGGVAPDVYVTRLHVRYDASHFPEDLLFQVTDNKENFQARYIMHHPWMGEASCEAASQYRAGLPERFRKEAQNLSQLTGWPVQEIRQKMRNNGQAVKATWPEPQVWWKTLWD